MNDYISNGVFIPRETTNQKFLASCIMNKLRTIDGIYEQVVVAHEALSVLSQPSNLTITSIFQSPIMRSRALS